MSDRLVELSAKAGVWKSSATFSDLPISLKKKVDLQ
jgi:hypothetical protein